MSAASRPLRYDPKFKSYDPLFKRAWAEEIGEVVEGTPYHDSVMDLCISFKAASHTHTMPQLMVKGLESFWAAYRDPEHATAFVPKIINHVTGRVSGELRLSNKYQKHRLRESVAKLAVEADRANKVAQESETFPADKLWHWYISHDEESAGQFQLLIWGSQRFCYQSLFHAHESFLRAVLCIKIPKGTNWRPNFELLSDETTAHLGAAIAAECVDHEEVDTARIIRNCLAHNGGRVTKTVKDSKHKIVVEGGMLQIMPDDNRALYALLTDRATKFVRAAV